MNNKTPQPTTEQKLRKLMTEFLGHANILTAADKPAEPALDEAVSKLEALLLEAERKALKEFVSFVEGTTPETKIAARAIVQRYNMKQEALTRKQVAGEDDE